MNVLFVALWQWALAACGAIVALVLAYWRGRRAVERDAAEKAIDAQKRADRAAGDFRRDGASRRLREGKF